MTTQSTVYPEPNASSVRKSSTDDRSATESLEAAAPDLKSKLRSMVDSGKARATEWKGGVEGGIRNKPVQSVLIAAAVGALIGLIIGRRRS